MTQAESLTILKTGANVYLTGEPGSGKSYTIGRYVEYLREHGIEPAITASTGIAATHIHGMTIHSWSGIGVRRQLTDHDLDMITSNEYVVRRVSKTKVLIIDEISMLDGTTLDMVDRVCREVKRSEEAFGGIQTILVGDFFQLPPISRESTETNFAFNGQAWQELKPVICYLHEQHRQEDPRFLAFLSALRTSSLEEEHIDCLTERITHFDDVPDDVPKLFPHNANVDLLNDRALGQLSTDSHIYEMEREGHEALTASLMRSCLSPEKLTLKIGASVMFTKNNPQVGYANGTLGVVVGFDPYSSNPVVATRDGRDIVAEPMEWAIEENGKIRARIVQVPLRLAWAMTVHKSQGMSLDAAVMDLSASFEYGQGYVALSRVRTLKGLYLLGWNEKSLLVHPEIVEVDSSFKEQSAQARTAFGALSQPELETMHENFILVSGGTIKKKIKKVQKSKPIGAPKAKKGDTYNETLKLIQSGKKISEIAKERGFTDQTIFNHIERLFDANKLSLDDVLKYIPAKLEKDLPAIHGVFSKLETIWLGPVHEYFNGKYTYNELRLARVLFPDRQKFDQRK